MSKHAFGGRSMFNKTENSTNIFYFGKVESNYDEFDGGTIQVRIKGIDDHVLTKDLASAFPLIPKTFHLTPKVGETVLIFIPDASNPFTDRVYSGPIISQPQFIEKDSHFFTSRSMMDSGISEPKEAPSGIPENKGVNPYKEDVAIQGRKNTDIIFKPNQILIRAGKFVSTDKKNETKIFNDKNPAYIQLKHDVPLNKTKSNGTKADGKVKKGTVVNVVGSKINLLSHTGDFNLTDQNEMITDDEMLKILDEAHPLIFGDNIVEYLKLQREVIINHVHPYHGKKAQDLSGSDDIKKFLDYNLDNVLSKNIRIN